MSFESVCEYKKELIQDLSAKFKKKTFSDFFGNALKENLLISKFCKEKLLKINNDLRLIM